jgi:DNA modification methylase
MDISTNIVYNGDCLDILKIIPNKSIDMILVDLPYGQTACDWDIPIDLEDMWKELNRICKENTCMTFFTTTKYGYKLIQSNEKMFRYDLVMPKGKSVGFLNANKQPLRAHELIYVFYNKQPIYNPQKIEGLPYRKTLKNNVDKEIRTGYYGTSYMTATNNTTGLRHPISILPKYYIEKVKNNHYTRKSIKICEWLIKTYTNENDIVLDFTCGSGSTLKGCINTNRRYIGIEKDPEIYKQCLENLQ